MNVYCVLLSAALTLAASALGANPRAMILEARIAAYDANYRNDQAGLKSAIATLTRVTDGHADASYAHYYSSWTYLALYVSQVQAKDSSGALVSAREALEHARLGLAARPRDAEFHSMLTQALVALMLADRTQFATLYAQATEANRLAVQLGPTNPRVVLMDAGMIFNNPTDPTGRERGVARFEEALKLFDAEAQEATADAMAPRWGYATAHMIVSSTYLRTSPPRRDDARAEARRALELRPDFWYVREVLLPQLGDK